MKTKIIIVFVIFLLFLPSISFSESKPPSPRPAKTSNEPNTTSQKPNMVSSSPDKVPPLIKSPIPPQAYINTSEASNKIDNESSADRWLIVFFTAALVVVGVLQWLTYRIQTRQLKQTNNIMKDTAERQLRAYIGVPGGTIQLQKNPDGVKAHVMVNSKNAGQTPAYNVRSWIALQIATFPLNEILVQPPPDAKYPISILSPGSEHSLFNDIIITSEQLLLLGTTQATIYVYGKILYKDVFGKEWFTKYRFLYGGDEGTQGDRLRIDLEGNEAN